MSTASPSGSMLSSRRRLGDGNQLKRTTSEISRSSSSSEIQVTSLPPRSTYGNAVNGGILANPYTASGNSHRNSGNPKCWVVDGRMLVIKLPQESNGHANGTKLDDAERNARGTYSREYTVQHPEIRWVHRGQGRYLPADEIKKEPAPMPERRSRHSKANQEDADGDSSVKAEPAEPATQSSAPRRKGSKYLSVEGRESIRAGVAAYWARKRREKAQQAGDQKDEMEDSVDLGTAGDPEPLQHSLRHRPSEPETPSALDMRATRLARRAKPVSSIENSARSTLRNNYFAIDDETEEESDEMEERSGAQTFNKEYVDAHRDEEFHHTGNGWYKRGPRPSGKKPAKERKSDSLTLKRDRKNSSSFTEDQSVHRDDLDNFPGCEFHHKGNGWYKPGPDPRGHRSSIVVPELDGKRGPKRMRYQKEDSEEDEEVSESESVSESDDDAAEIPTGTVDRAYKEAHPGFEWVHRGNGRYVRKGDIVKDVATPVSATPVAAPVPAPAAATTGRRQSDITYPKSYKEAHPEIDFYHTGNARYKIGRKPGAKPESESESEEPEGLVDKAYVDSHPKMKFHHRGQGRYALGPRPTVVTPAREDTRSEEEESDVDRTALVDSAYVHTHPEVTFHHKGQGRWAFGMPPPGSHNKIAIRGPGAKDRNRLSQEEDDEASRAPALTALVVREEGPDQFPSLTWHYRGGGKWGRMTKQEFEQMNTKGTKGYKIGSVSKYNGRKRQKLGEGPEAQLERETAAAERTRVGDDEYGFQAGNDVDRNGLPPGTKLKRGRKPHRGLGQPQRNAMGTKDTSNEHSKAPTPRPRMLEEHEDVLTEADLPDIFRDHSTPPPGAEDPVEKLLRQNHSALNTDKIVASLTKFNPVVRRLDVLKAVAANAQDALNKLQEEYLMLEKKTAIHAKIPRKPVKGGRVPLDSQVFEDKKEADLYDYQYDPRRLGFQDPEAQRIVRDAEGRELRKRRNRTGADPSETVPGWHFGEGPGELSAKRQSRQPHRFDSITEQPSRKRNRGLMSATFPDSMTPSRAATPLGGAPQSNTYLAPTAGRWAGHVPKRIQQLRAESEVSVQSDGGSKVRKGRPPGSKNLHKRRDAGIKKGPRKKPAVPSIEQANEATAAGAGERRMAVGGGESVVG